MGALHGAGFLLRGLRTWRERPALMALGLVPAVLVFAALAAFLVWVALGADALVSWATPFADDWADPWQGILRIGLHLALFAGSVLFSIIAFTGLALAVGDPFYEKIWKETERLIGGPVPEGGVGWLRGAKDGLVLVLFGVATTVLVFVIGLLPVIGPVLGPLLAITLGGRVLGRELVSRAFEARGMDRAARKAAVVGHRGSVLGFGVAVQACCLVPLGAVVMMPAAVVGATYLAREILDHPVESPPSAG